MTTSSFDILQLREATAEAASQLDALVNYLTEAERPAIDCRRLQAILANPHSALFVARRSGTIVGLLMVTHYVAPTSEKVWVEDVVVAPSVRGEGVGRRLVGAAIEWSRSNHPAAKIYLTSNPSRLAARALYASMGFEEYNTGVFRQ